jgi:hypothetical protein
MLAAHLRLIAVAVLLAVTGCGGGENFSGGGREESPSDTPDEAAVKNPTCPLRAVELKETPTTTTVGLGEPFTVDLTKPSAERAGVVTLSVERAETAASIDDTFTDRGRFQTAQTQRFVTIVFSLTNEGDGQIEAANSVNESMLLTDGRGRAWKRADGSAECSTVSPSAAAREKGTQSPEADLGPGQVYTTVVTYVVPKGARALAWTGPGVRVPVNPE